MKSWIRKIMRLKWARIVALALSPFSVTPMDHIRRKRAWKRAAAQSLLASGVFASAFASFLDGMATSNAAKAPSAAAAVAIQHQWGAYTWLFKAESVALMLGLIFGTALIRWSYNALAAYLFKRVDPTVQRPPYSFFVEISASLALWFGAFAWGLSKLIAISNGKPAEYVQRLELDHPVWMIAACFAVYFGTTFARKQQQRGMEEVYGGSPRRVLLLDLGVVVLCVGFLFLFSHLAAHAAHPK